MAGVLLRRQALARDSLRLLASQRQRWASSLPQPISFPATDFYKTRPPQKDIVYEGSMAATLRRVKILSFCSFSLSSVGAPVLAFHTYPDVSIVAKSSIAFLMIMLSALTTAGLHWYAASYVRKLVWKPGTKEFYVETYDILGRPIGRTIQFSDVVAPDSIKPLATFFARGYHFYVEEDRFPPELLRKLLPRRGF